MLKEKTETASQILEEGERISLEITELEKKEQSVKSEIKKEEADELKKVRDKFKAKLTKSTKDIADKLKKAKEQKSDNAQSKDILIGQLFTKKAKGAITTAEEGELELLVKG